MVQSSSERLGGGLGKTRRILRGTCLQTHQGTPPQPERHFGLTVLLLWMGTGTACTLGGPSDRDQDGSTDRQDCAPLDPSIHPGAPERCDGQDNNCDGRLDEADPALQDGQEYFADQDSDGFGTPLDPRTLCTPSWPHTSPDPRDCDDSDASAYPDAPERCDGDLEDCNGLADQVDTDQDGYSACTQDCDDTAEDIHPGALELCDGRDNDCTGTSDDGTASQCLDSDGDGFSPEDGDCNDHNPDTYPGAPERCNDHEDNGCSSTGAHLCRLTGTRALNQAELTLEGPGEGARFGTTLEVGDLNLDGQEDLIVGAPGYRVGGLQVGAVYVFLGPLEPDPAGPIQALQASLSYIHPKEEGSLGEALAFVPASAGRTAPALLLGSPRQGGAGLRAGAAYLVSWQMAESSIDPSQSGVTLLGEAAYDGAGATLASADINGDGVWDLLIGAAEAGSGSLEQAGMTYIFTRRPQGTESLEQADARLVGPESSTLSSSAITAGAFSQENPADVLIGAYHEGAGPALWGLEGPLSGRISLKNAPLTLMVEDPGGYMTWNVGRLAHWFGAGWDGQIIGAPKADLGDTDAGAIFILEPELSGERALSASSTILWGTVAGGELGGALGGCLDVDEDGHLDLLLGAARADLLPEDGLEGSGSAWLVYGPLLGSQALDSMETLHLTGMAPGDLAGSAVRLSADLSGDGVPDLVIGSPHADGSGTSAGRVSIILGRSR